MADNEKVNSGETSVRTIQYTEGKSAGILSVMSVSNYETLKENNPKLPTVYLHIDGKYCECIQYNKTHWVISSVNYRKISRIPVYLDTRFCEQQNPWSENPTGVPLQMVSESRGATIVYYDVWREKNKDLQEEIIREKSAIYLMTAKDYQECFETHEAACVKFLEYRHTRHYVRGETEEGPFLGSVPGVIVVNDNCQFYANADWFVERFGKYEQKCRIGIARIEGDRLRHSFMIKDIAYFLCDYYLDKYHKIPEDIWEWHDWMLDKPIDEIEDGSKVIEFTLKKGDDTKAENNQNGTLILLSAKDFVKYRSDYENQAIVGIRITDEKCLGVKYEKNSWITSNTEFFLTLGKSTEELKSGIKIATAQYQNKRVQNIKSVPSIYKPHEVFDLYRSEYEKNIMPAKQYALGKILIHEKVPVFILVDGEYMLVRDRLIKQQKTGKKSVYRECCHRITQRNKDGQMSTWDARGILDLVHYRFYTGANSLVERIRGVPQKFEMRTVRLNQEQKSKKAGKPYIRENTKSFFDYYLFLRNGTRSIDGSGKKAISVEAEETLSKEKAESEKALKQLKDMGALDFRELVPPHGIIYLFSKKCHCSNCDKKGYGSNIYSNTALVKTKTGFGVPITVQCCGWCGRVYMNYQMYKTYDKKYGGLEFRAELVASEAEEAVEEFGFAADSFLSRNGYSVKEDVPKSSRQAVLANILDTHIATKQEIIEKITEFINLRRNDYRMKGAIARWEEDIAFVADYHAGSQDNIGEHEIHQAGKITDSIY